MWADLAPVGRDRVTGGYRRYAWTAADATLRDWFRAEAGARGLSVDDRPHRQPVGLDGGPRTPAARASSSAATSTRCPTAAPSTGRWASSPRSPRWTCCARGASRRGGRSASPASPTRRAPASASPAPARRLLTGALDPDRARALTDDDGTTMAEAMAAAGHDPAAVGRDDETLAADRHLRRAARRAGARRSSTRDAAVGVASAIWPHGRWRLDLRGRADHAGTTRLADRDDPMLALAAAVLAARAAAERHGTVATVGKVPVRPNGVNAIPSSVTAWLDARGRRRGRRPRGGRRASAAPRAASPGRGVRGRRPPTSTRDLRDRLGRACSTRARAGDRRGARRRHPLGRRHPDGDAVRPQPDRGLALPRRARRAATTASPASTPWPASIEALA